MSDTNIRLWPGWEIVRPLGEGSYGKVFEINRRNGNYLERSAMKILHVPESQAELDQFRMNGLTEENTERYLWRNVEKIRDEIGVMQQFVGYSNIVSYEDYLIQKQENGVGWDILIRMELLTPLQDYMKIHPFSEKEVLKLGLDISQALMICHGAGVIHRDIKPQNIFVNKQGFFKLGDFGISRSMPEQLGELSFKGTVSYMAPETFAMKGTDARSDIYSLALVLYRFLNGGKEPFLTSSGFTPEDLELARRRRLSGMPLPAPQFGSAGLQRVLAIALSPDPALRYQTAADFHAALKRVAEGKTVGIASSGPFVRITSLLRKLTDSAGAGRGDGLFKNRRLLIAIAAICVCVIAGVLFYYTYQAAHSTLSYRVSNEIEKVQMAMHTHQWEEATCTEPKTCSVCGKTEGEALGHKWKKATCEEPKICSVCGETEGEALGHKWKPATCTEPKTCSVCKKTEGIELGHDWRPATCIKPKTCRSCGKTEGVAMGHDWKEATYDTPKMCSRCKETQGNVKGYIPYYVLEQGNWAEKDFDEHDYSITPWVFDKEIKKCRKLRVGYGVEAKEGNPLGIYECWVRSHGKWKMIGTVDVKEEEKAFEATFIIKPPIDIDAILFEPQKSYRDGHLSWASIYEFYEAQGE